MTKKITISKNDNKAEDKIEQKQKTLSAILDDLKGRFGEGSIMKLGEVKKVDVDVIPTGSITLDFALGVGGLPRGRVVEIYGDESSGKTTLALHVITEAQRAGGVAAFVDAEHALDPEYAKKIGVDIDNLLISQPDTGEQALEIVESLVRSGVVDVIVVDSVAALTPRVEIEGEMGDSHIGLQARLMSQALRKLTAVVAKTNTIVIFINQTRMKIGVMFGNPETTPGGMALKFYASVRINVKRIAQVKQGEKIIGNRIKAVVVKNKVAPPFKFGEFDIIYNEGISRESELLNLGLKNGFIKKVGNTLIFENQKLGVGLEAARQFLKENKQVFKDILKKARETFLKSEETTKKQ